LQRYILICFFATFFFIFLQTFLLLNMSKTKKSLFRARAADDWAGRHSSEVPLKKNGPSAHFSPALIAARRRGTAVAGAHLKI